MSLKKSSQPEIHLIYTPSVVTLALQRGRVEKWKWTSVGIKTFIPPAWALLLMSRPRSLGVTFVLLILAKSKIQCNWFPLGTHMHTLILCCLLLLIILHLKIRFWKGVYKLYILCMCAEQTYRPKGPQYKINVRTFWASLPWFQNEGWNGW